MKHMIQDSTDESTLRLARVAEIVAAVVAEKAPGLFTGITVTDPSGNAISAPVAA